MESYGIPVDKIVEISGQPIPLNLYTEIAARQERTAKEAEVVLYSTTHLPETKALYYEDQDLMDFEATVIDVFRNVEDDKKPNILILD